MKGFLEEATDKGQLQSWMEETQSMIQPPDERQSKA